MIIFSLVLIALMLLRPQGLFGALPRMAARKPTKATTGPTPVPR
jgi:hypothetical protein